ncbi:unnamed protein product, partial [Iphiclides podalirius]
MTPHAPTNRPPSDAVYVDSAPDEPATEVNGGELIAVCIVPVDATRVSTGAIFMCAPRLHYWVAIGWASGAKEELGLCYGSSPGEAAPTAVHLWVPLTRFTCHLVSWHRLFLSPRVFTLRWRSINGNGGPPPLFYTPRWMDS